MFCRAGALNMQGVPMLREAPVTLVLSREWGNGLLGLLEGTLRLS